MSHARTSITALALAGVLAAAPAVSAPAEAPFPLAPLGSIAAESLRVAGAPDPIRALRLTLAVVDGPSWPAERLRRAILGVARILAPCAIVVENAEIYAVDAPAPFLDFATPTARELVRRTGLPKPTLYFVHDTREAPAFDAEAIGRGNARGRPELVDTVWITAATPDLDVAIAHELVHLLTESGAHLDTPRNLMRDETAPENTVLTPVQCARARDVGTRKGLLVPAGTAR